MAVGPLPETSAQEEAALVTRAQQGDSTAIASLLEPWRSPLFGYIYRIVTHRQDAEDLLQEVVLRVLRSIREFRGEARFKTWVFGIATHVCLDHLRKKKRWRVDAQLLAEGETDADPAQFNAILDLMHQPEFSFEIREHIAFCFSCIGRSLPPDEQSAVMLIEVFGFTSLEAAKILGISEPKLRHALSAARAKMQAGFDGLCALINKKGVCHQCSGLREGAGEGHRGPDLIQIEVAPGIAVTADSLFDARLAIVRSADLESGRSHKLHDIFFTALTKREES
jgi:RNA polymerase sigma-70 factor, ECF subfamily